MGADNIRTNIQNNITNNYDVLTHIPFTNLPSDNSIK